jgi:hypothetical protein
MRYIINARHFQITVTKGFFLNAFSYSFLYFQVDLEEHKNGIHILGKNVWRKNQNGLFCILQLMIENPLVPLCSSQYQRL